MLSKGGLRGPWVETCGAMGGSWGQALALG